MHETDDSHANGDSDIDLQAVLAMAGGDVGLLRDLIGAFLDEVPRLLKTLHAAVEIRAVESVQTVAHQLQGVMRCLHIETALQQARQLEQLAEETADWHVIDEVLDKLEKTTRRATDKLNEFLGEQG